MLNDRRPRARPIERRALASAHELAVIFNSIQSKSKFKSEPADIAQQPRELPRRLAYYKPNLASNKPSPKPAELVPDVKCKIFYHHLCAFRFNH